MSGVAGWLAVALAGAAAVLLIPGPVPLRGPQSSPRGRLSPALVTVAAAMAGLVLWSWLDTKRFILAALLAATALGVGRLVQRRRAARSAEQRSDQVLAVCDSMASDLAAGQPPLRSLDRAASEWAGFAPVAVAGHMGADVPSVLRELSGLPGARQLRTLAATWQVAHETGSGLAGAIGTAAEAIRTDRRTARLVSAELAAAHATARMLAVLPIGVLLLGSGVGGDPVGLVGTVPGLVCLALGLGLSFAGMLWLERIADRVLRR
ncbi:MAG: type secretion system protein [Marmoricola sp.]|nr:type secretion system protein [Marmoricola sp.]